MRHKNRFSFFALPFLALGVLVMGGSAEGHVVEVSIKQEGVVANINRDNMKLEDIDVEVVVVEQEVEEEVVMVEKEVAEVEQKMLASESLDDLRLELGRTLLLQGGLEVELGHILVRVKKSKNFKDSNIFHAKTLRIELVKASTFYIFQIIGPLSRSSRHFADHLHIFRSYGHCAEHMDTFKNIWILFRSSG